MHPRPPTVQLPPPDSFGPCRVVVDHLHPALEGGRYPLKHIEGDPLEIRAHVFADGHDQVEARLEMLAPGAGGWEEHPLEFLTNDEWKGTLWPGKPGLYHYNVVGWVDPFLSWRHGFARKLADGQQVEVEARIGEELLRQLATRIAKKSATPLTGWLAELEHPSTSLRRRIEVLLLEDALALYRSCPDRRHQSRAPFDIPFRVEPKRAAFSTWYEFFPRSEGSRAGTHGTLREAAKRLPDIAGMGFDVVYLPPIHPIGQAHRKGKNNTLTAEPGDVGSPWAIGSKEGGHKAIHPELGTLEDFRYFVKTGLDLGLHTALDIAFQCAPDHPYVREHPQWFRWRPDGTVQYAENPPKKYQDILPFDFENDDWRSLWEELRSVFTFWIDQGVTIFRVDNPHTKPLEFWRWLIESIKADHPEIVFLSEAFTRPKLKYRLGKVGFTQGYTYFTWRNSKEELEQYLTELCSEPTRHLFWPNFWPNTPDILPEMLQRADPSAFALRLVLAATLSSNYGMYGPAYELCVNDPFPGKEEYNLSEKYELKRWNRQAPGNLRLLIHRLNWMRRRHPALQRTFNVRFVPCDNPLLIAYLKEDPNGIDRLLMVVNLDPHHTQSGWIDLPLDALKIGGDEPMLLQDLLSDPVEDMPSENYTWVGGRNYVELSPAKAPAHVFRILRFQHSEKDFDYWA